MRGDRKPGLQFSNEATLLNKLGALLRNEDGVDEAKVRQLLAISEDDLRALIKCEVNALKRNFQPGKRDPYNNARKIGAVDDGLKFETILKYADEKNVVKLLAEYDQSVLKLLRDNLVADDTAEELLNRAIQRNKNAGLHQLREEWLSKTDPLSRKTAIEKEDIEISARKSRSDPGPKK